jgi:hypothetical protein
VISYIVASHHYPTLRDNLGSTIQGVDADEVVVVECADSIAKAYNEGQARATQPIRCYVHHDVQILDAPRLRSQLLRWCQPWVGVVGVVGSWNRAVPYWDGALCGSVEDTRVGVIGPGKGGQCAYLDGLLLATVQTMAWDESYPGWHGYDHDMCEQLLAQGLVNWCLPDGHELVRHNTTGGWEPDGLDEALDQFRKKWGVECRTP